MVKTLEGKVLVFSVTTGQQLERWPVDAKLLIANGEATYDPPEGVQPKVSSPPPERVGVPVTPVATTFTASPGEKGVVETAEKVKGK